MGSQRSGGAMFRYLKITDQKHESHIRDRGKSGPGRYGGISENQNVKCQFLLKKQNVGQGFVRDRHGLREDVLSQKQAKTWGEGS